MGHQIMTDLILYNKKEIVEYKDPLSIVKEKTIFKNRAEVKKQLPDICARALAIAWIDEAWKIELMSDPQTALERKGVYLPKDMGIEYEGAYGNRPRLVIFEEVNGTKFKLRVCALQLTMMASR
jgi:hypothetical protein